ncbi:uncharacterized protein LOC122067387 [Macadamia integrifolia]|uniref:uncharacterized protein LOC122067387 n=1 Tax=Macadamia integrifolia TaxID=60698 RepID=UPI001C4EB7B7|nr:uncharacterized protein LOC122067387 [Macadamia integrifolia]
MWNFISDNERWVIGISRSIDFWNDNWLGPKPIRDLSDLVEDVLSSLSHPVADFIDNGKWDGLRCPNLAVSWAALVWHKHLPPRLSLLGWRWLHRKLPTDDLIQVKGIQFPSKCDLCDLSTETFSHLFLDCQLSSALWSKTTELFNEVWIWKAIVVEIAGFWSNKGKGWCLKETWLAGLFSTLAAIWHERNQRHFEGKKRSPSVIFNGIKGKIVFLCSRLKFSPKSVADLILCSRLHLENSSQPMLRILEVHWCKPMRSWVKLNSDGCSLGNPGRAGGGGILGDHDGRMLIRLIPWFLLQEWNHLFSYLINSIEWKISHYYREANPIADFLAKDAAKSGTSSDDVSLP